MASTRQIGETGEEHSKAATKIEGAEAQEDQAQALVQDTQAQSPARSSKYTPHQWNILTLCEWIGAAIHIEANTTGQPVSLPRPEEIHATWNEFFARLRTIGTDKEGLWREHHQSIHGDPFNKANKEKDMKVVLQALMEEAIDCELGCAEVVERMMPADDDERSDLKNLWKQ